MNSVVDSIRTSFDEVDASPKGFFNSTMELGDAESNMCANACRFRPS